MAKILLVGEKRIPFAKSKAVAGLIIYLQKKGWKYYIFDFDAMKYSMHENGRRVFLKTMKIRKKK